MLVLGSLVRLHGLTGAAHLNGHMGLCRQWDEGKGRWNVHLMHTGEVKALKPENLELCWDPAQQQQHLQQQQQAAMQAAQWSAASYYGHAWGAAQAAWANAAWSGWPAAAAAASAATAAPPSSMPAQQAPPHSAPPRAVPPAGLPKSGGAVPPANPLPAAALASSSEPNLADTPAAGVSASAGSAPASMSTPPKRSASPDPLERFQRMIGGPKVKASRRGSSKDRRRKLASSSGSSSSSSCAQSSSSSSGDSSSSSSVVRKKKVVKRSKVSVKKAKKKGKDKGKKNKKNASPPRRDKHKKKQDKANDRERQRKKQEKEAKATKIDAHKPAAEPKAHFSLDSSALQKQIDGLLSAADEAVVTRAEAAAAEPRAHSTLEGGALQRQIDGLLSAADEAVVTRAEATPRVGPLPPVAKSSLLGKRPKLAAPPAVPPSAPAAARAPSGASSAGLPPTQLEALRLRARIRRLYERHAPEKLPSLEILLNRYRGSEAEVYQRACRLYGEEPVDMTLPVKEDHRKEHEAAEDLHTSALDVVARAPDATAIAAIAVASAADAGDGADAASGALDVAATHHDDDAIGIASDAVVADIEDDHEGVDGGDMFAAASASPSQLPRPSAAPTMVSQYISQASTLPTSLVGAGASLRPTTVPTVAPQLQIAEEAASSGDSVAPPIMQPTAKIKPRRKEEEPQHVTEHEDDQEVTCLDEAAGGWGEEPAAADEQEEPVEEESAEDKPFVEEDVTCPNGHPLMPLGTSCDDDWACNGDDTLNFCQSGDLARADGLIRLRCERCDYDLCEKCYLAILEAQTGSFDANAVEGAWEDSAVTERATSPLTKRPKVVPPTVTVSDPGTSSGSTAAGRPKLVPKIKATGKSALNVAAMLAAKASEWWDHWEKPDKVHGDCWETPRSSHKLKLVGEAAGELQWGYPLKDESRRSFAGLLRRPFTEAHCAELFETIRENTTWQRPMQWNGPMPRKTAWMVRKGCSCTYRYGSAVVNPQEFPPWMIQLMQETMPKCGITDMSAWPDSCNLNLYDDGGMTVGWHADDEQLFQGKFRDITILSMSLGVKRKFELRMNWPEQGETPVVKIDLGSGDLMTMEGMTQKHFQHRVPREDNVSGPRINLTWRWILKHTPRCPAGCLRPPPAVSAGTHAASPGPSQVAGAAVGASSSSEPPAAPAAAGGGDRDAAAAARVASAEGPRVYI